MTVDAALGGSDFVFNGYPHDCTEGTGVFPAGGVITLANPTLRGMTRKWLFIQNQGAADIRVTFAATLANGSTLSTVSVILSAGAGAGLAGASYENFHQLFSIVGAITITGAAGAAIVVLERLK